MFNQVESINLNNEREKREVISFLEEFGLKWAEGIDYTVVLRDGGEIKATCSKEKNVFKCFAVSKDLQGEGVSTKLLTHLNNKLFDEGIFHSFIFTKPENEDIFKGIGYKVVEKASKVVLLENGIGGIKKEIANMRKRYNIEDEKKRAAIVMNCNPFTNGHRYLIEKAASENEEVIVFIVQEDKSLFPFENRIKMVRDGVKDLENVKVVPGGEYIISSATFPNYFLREDDDKLEIFTQLDARIFKNYFCKILNIKLRYLGQEPYCEVTKKYNDSLKAVLSEDNIEVRIIERKKSEGQAISASNVRDCIKNDQWHIIENIVPKTTMEFLKSPNGKEIVEKIKRSNSPH